MSWRRVYSHGGKANTHPNARTNAVHHYDGTTNFLLSPSIGTSPEGQVLILELELGSKNLKFQYWSVDKNGLIKEIPVAARKKYHLIEQIKKYVY